MLQALDIIPARGVAASVDDWLLKLVDQDCSDITLLPQERAKAELGGRLVDISKSDISQSELTGLLTKIYGSSGQTLIPKTPLDFAYEVITKDRRRRRFRVNVSLAFHSGERGYHFSIRILDACPPPLSQIGLTEAIVKTLNKDRGMTLVGGGTGTGKSTTLASILAYILQIKAGKGVTIEAPIEYVYDDVPNKIGFVSQHEVGKGIDSFAQGLKNALRQKPAWILVQEIRDPETAETATEAAMTGHPLFATIHANTAAEMITRIADMFPPQIKRGKMVEFLRNTNVLIAQRLIPKCSKGKIAVREFFHFNRDIRADLLKKEPDDWPFIIEGIMREEKTDMAAGIQELVNAGTIEERWIEWTTR